MTLIPIVLDKKESILREANLFKIWYTNADCLTNKMEELQALINNEQVDAFAITEVLPKHSHFKRKNYRLKVITVYQILKRHISTTVGALFYM